MQTGNGPKMRSAPVAACACRSGTQEERKRTMALAESDIAIESNRAILSRGGPAAPRWRFDPVAWELGRADPATPRWIVLHTRSRQEKVVSELLESNGF